MKFFVVSGLAALALAGIGNASEVGTHHTKTHVVKKCPERGSVLVQKEVTTVDVVREQPVELPPLIKPDTINIGNAGFVTFFRGPDAWDAAF